MHLHASSKFTSRSACMRITPAMHNELKLEIEWAKLQWAALLEVGCHFFIALYIAKLQSRCRVVVARFFSALGSKQVTAKLFFSSESINS